MTYRLVSNKLAATVLAATVSSAFAGVRTTVELHGDPGPAHRLAMPGIAVRAEGLTTEDAGIVTAEIERELKSTAYTRPVASGERGDYGLRVRAESRVTTPTGATIPFQVELTDAGGLILWTTRGRTEVEGRVEPGAEALSIARNVVSALMHDGWIQQRLDPNDMPPPAPTVRHD